ncbi:MAG: MBL fold metallo-hydrolase [Candidatus Thorarchaeota archaeon]|jgi:glyoxylase-like metal-dependent hydrolase (beta-lactamase superfamily II)
MSEYAPSLEIEPHVHLIRGLNKGRFPEANSLFIDDEILTLVDAGSDMSQVSKTLKSLGHRMEDIERLILTHFHLDHKHHSEEIHEISGCEVICHPLSDKGVETFQGMAEYYGITNHRVFDTWKDMVKGWIPPIHDDYTVTGHYEDMKTISCGAVDLIPIHLPGHTLDHTCFGINGFEIIFLVDIDLTGFGPWYGNDVSDIREFQESIKRVMNLEPKMGISSHLLDPVTDDLSRRLGNYQDTFEEREVKILKNISEGFDTLEKLIRLPTIYPRIPNEVFLVFEEYMVLKHLEILLEDAKIVQEGNQYRIEKR